MGYAAKDKAPTNASVDYAAMPLDQLVAAADLVKVDEVQKIVDAAALAKALTDRATELTGYAAKDKAPTAASVDYAAMLLDQLVAAADLVKVDEVQKIVDAAALAKALTDRATELMGYAAKDKAPTNASVDYAAMPLDQLVAAADLVKVDEVQKIVDAAALAKALTDRATELTGYAAKDKAPTAASVDYAAMLLDQLVAAADLVKVDEVQKIVDAAALAKALTDRATELMGYAAKDKAPTNASV